MGNWVVLPENLLFPPVKHSFILFSTATSGVPDFPEFVGSASVDEVQVGYYDSNIKTAEPKVDWARKFIKDDPQHLEWYVNRCYESQLFFSATIDSLVKRLNQTEGAHILQQMHGCEWDDETGEVRGFNQYGYDGEDFMSLDLQTLTWTASKPEAFITKLRWDADKARLEDNKYNLLHVFPDLLKKYVQSTRSSLHRTGRITQPPHTTQHNSICFCPQEHPMKIKQGIDKMSVDLNISSIAPENWKKYNCVFQMSDVKDDIITKLDKSVIRTNWVSPPWRFIVAAIKIAVKLLLFPCIVGLYVSCPAFTFKAEICEISLWQIIDPSF
uniref:MHC class I-like antigen recognition-like domain-containing protein n=1 Tax=Acanthochromis polyacanthus TaxID=80966 RepID=A0A3Q1GHH9_9TELE